MDCLLIWLEVLILLLKLNYTLFVYVDAYTATYMKWLGYVRLNFIEYT